MSGHEIHIEEWDLFPFACERSPAADIIAEHGRTGAMEAIIKMAQHTLSTHGMPQESYLPVFDPLRGYPKERDEAYDLLMTSPITLLKDVGQMFHHPESENYPEVSLSHAPEVRGRYIIDPDVFALEVDDREGLNNLLTICMTGKGSRRNIAPNANPITTGEGRPLSNEQLQEVFEAIAQINIGLQGEDPINDAQLAATRHYPCRSGWIGREVQRVIDIQFTGIVRHFNT